MYSRYDIMRQQKVPVVAAAVVLLLWGLALASCSVISRDIRADAKREIHFESLAQEASQYEGKTVILGGYILENRNLSEQTRLLVLQAPLTIRDEPGDRDLSEGRFVVLYDGFLDPAVYEKGRKITVAGKILGRESLQINGYTCFIPLLDAREIHLWQTPREPPCYYQTEPFDQWPDSFLHYRTHPLFYW